MRYIFFLPYIHIHILVEQNQAITVPIFSGPGLCKYMDFPYYISKYKYVPYIHTYRTVSNYVEMLSKMVFSTNFTSTHFSVLLVKDHNNAIGTFAFRIFNMYISIILNG